MMIRRQIKKILAVLLLVTVGLTSFDIPVCAASNGETLAGVSENVDQDNYVAMLNYIALVNNEINVSSNNKIFLDEVYSSLMNNTAPHSIDDRTQIQFNDMLHTIDKYRMLDVKRERLQYIYEQNQAQALRDAVPNPIGLLSGASAFRLSSLIASVVYMAVDSKASYESATADADMQYLKDGWELDDEETKALNQNQEQLFNYMVDMAHKSGMPDKYALANDTIKEYVQYKNNSNVSRKITYLETNQSTYEKFGDYWLTLADSYYHNKDYEKCLDAIDNYTGLDIEIFRKDHGLAKELPLAISSAQEAIKSKQKRVERVDNYLSLLKKNIETEDWALRYFAAQTDLYLYSETKEDRYLNDAYMLTKDNVNYLIDEQSKLNRTYLAEVKKRNTPKSASKAEKKEIKQYNKMLEKDRKTELPPVYEPLYLNCNLLFALAGETHISDVEKTRIEKILHGDQREDPLFLTSSLDNSYYFNGKHKTDDSKVSYGDGALKIPANLVSARSQITVSVESGKRKAKITDWTVKEVKRKKGDPVTAMTVLYESKTGKKFDYQDGDKITVVLTPVDGSKCPDIKMIFNAKEKKWLKIIPEMVFERTK